MACLDRLLPLQLSDTLVTMLGAEPLHDAPRCGLGAVAQDPEILGAEIAGDKRGNGAGRRPADRLSLPSAACS